MATTQEIKELILGPQTPIGTSYFDWIQIERGKFHGRAFPAIPPLPTDANWNSYYMTHYYDLGLGMGIDHERTKDPEFLALFQKVEDSWWKQPEIDEGRKRWWLQGTVTPDPRHAGLSGLILRAVDRPEMWDWINSYTRFHLDHWLLKRLTSPTLFYGVRPGAFMLQAAAILAFALPDSFPLQSGGTVTNGAELRAQYLADVEKIAVQYYGRLQQADGSWRWDDPDYTDSDGGQLRGIMQPFMIGLLLNALIKVHQVSTNETVRTNVLNQITKACRHLYSGGPYMTQLVPSLGVKRRGMAYFIHGGTTVNPSRYEKGNYPENWDTTNPSDVQNMRQGISTIVAAFGYAYQLTKDPFFKAAGDELWDAAYGESDKIRNYMAGDAKSYNQNCSFAPSYLALAGAIVQPTPSPLPAPAPAPAPTKPPSPDGTKGITITDSTGGVWTLGPEKQTLRDGIHMGRGAGSIYKWHNGAVYVLGTDVNWYKWSGSTWSSVGPLEPGVTIPPPTPTPVPSPAPVTRTSTWPKQVSKQNPIIEAQWKEKFRLKSVSDGSAVFEKVG